MADTSFEAARKLIEDTLTSFGIDPAKARAKDEASLVAWSLKRGSASVLVSIMEQSDAPTRSWLRVAASVMIVPTDPAKKAALFQHLLELNARGLLNAAFALVGDRVIAVSERPTAGLDGSEVEQVIKHLSAVADTYDDRLVGEFGGKRASDA
jgi:hypothetical protein